MNDPRLGQLARVLVNYSVGVRPGDLVRITGAPVTEPLVVALYREVVLAGGHPLVRLVPDECQELLLKLAGEAQLGHTNPLALHEVETIDCSIGIWGDANTKALTNCDPARQALFKQSRKKITETFLKRAAAGQLRWVGTEFPTHAGAQDAEMSLTEFEDFVFSAGLLDRPDPAAAWREVHDRQQCVCDELQRVSELRFVTPQGTDLIVGVAGRHWVNCDGKVNFPDGEVFTGPIEDATRGVLVLDFPAVYEGHEVNGVRLEFKDGRVVGASANKGEDFLLAMLDQDPGGRILGEVALATNYSVQRFMRNALFDEKIGGTFHVALGAAYPETGGTNQSGLHWDLVCDLRNGGSVLADGRAISQNGRFLDPGWPQPA